MIKKVKKIVSLLLVAMCLVLGTFIVVEICPGLKKTRQCQGWLGFFFCEGVVILAPRKSPIGIALQKPHHHSPLALLIHTKSKTKNPHHEEDNHREHETMHTHHLQV